MALYRRAPSTGLQWHGRCSVLFWSHAVGCTFHVQAGFVSREVILLGLACGLVINNILVVNNYRDIDEDIRANKRTLVVLFKTRHLFNMAVVDLCGVHLFIVWQGRGLMILLGWLAIAYGFHLLRKLAMANTPVILWGTQRGGFGCGRYSGLVSLALFYF